MQLGVANTMASIRDEWWIPKRRSRVKKVINQCNTCRVFSTKPHDSTTTTEIPSFRTEDRRPFETTDFAGSLNHKITKKDLHLYNLKSRTPRNDESQTVEEF